VGERAVRATAAEQVLRGSRPSEDVLADAAGAVDGEIEPNGDIHASAGYRRHVAAVLVRRALETAVARARGGDSDVRA
jgi:carbon-monoxide dehydrogenase medium subunit